MKKAAVLFLALSVNFFAALSAWSQEVLTQEISSQEVLSIDASQELGQIRHGATGFLYGLGDPGIPSQQVLQALHPSVAAQKAPNGLQHPNGDAFVVAEQFFAAGGKELQIYMQDIYKQWPYEKLGINDYLPKIRQMVGQGKASPYREKLTYVPLNEPDVIWYNDNVYFRDFCADWKKCYETIKEVDSSARVAGPNTTVYNERFMERFLKFCKENDCVPEEITWHELQNDFFTDWENHFNSFRNLEKKYEISQRPIVINEYARFSGDLAMPGKLVQFIARFENTCVDACLAYWTTAGSLNDLVTHNSYGTGAWWLYYWYGQMNGERLLVKSPNPYKEGLQSLASFESNQNQIRAIAGGTAKAFSLEIQNVAQKFSLAQDANVEVLVKKTGSSALNPSVIPCIIIEENFKLSGGNLLVQIPSGNENDAYEIIVNPLSEKFKTSADKSENQSAKSANQKIRSSKWNFIARDENINAKNVEFAVQVEEAAYYIISHNSQKSISLKINQNSNEKNSVNLNANETKILFLGEGINLFNIETATSFEAQNLIVQVRKANSNIAKANLYEAESSENEMSERVSVNKKGNLVEQRRAANEEQFLSFKNVNVKKDGLYALTIRYQNGELGDGASNYNANIVDRSAILSINGEASKTVFFRNTLGWKDFYTTSVLVNLQSGNNTITFTSGAKKMLATFDWIKVAPFEFDDFNIEEKCDAENTSPNVQASNAESVKFPNKVSLSVIAVDDFFNEKDLTYKWTSESLNVKIFDDDKMFASAQVPNAGTYVFTCTVSDGIESKSVNVNALVIPKGMYEAESEKNILSGTANIATNANASGGKLVGYVGNGSENVLTFTGINVEKSGTYNITIWYVSGENRNLTLTTNNSKSVNVNCPSTGSWTTVGSVKAKIKLVAGDNTISISNASYYAPDIDCILIE